MNLKSLSDDVLLQAAESHARDERRSGIQVLWHLREIDRRMLYAKLRYGSLFTYAVKHLHYSEGAAMRQIDAMRLLKEMPELEEYIESGELSLTNLSLVKQAAKEAKKTITQTRMLLEEVKGKTKKECERILARDTPEIVPTEKERVLTPTHTEVRVVFNEAQLDKLNRLRALLSHKKPNPTYAELVEMLSDLALKELDPMEWKPKKKSLDSNTEPGKPDLLAPSSQTMPTPPAESEAGKFLEFQRTKSFKCSSPPTLRRSISRLLRKALFLNSGGKCLRCGSTHLLEIDHITPRAIGGTNAPMNLRVLCRSCNQYEAMRVLGTRFVRKHAHRSTQKVD